MTNWLKGILVAVLWASFAAPLASSDVQNVRVVGNGEPTRITIWAGAPLAAQPYLTQAETGARIVLDVNTAAGASGPMQPIDPATGVAGYGWQDGHLVFDLARPMMIARTLDLPPAGSEARHRLVLDLEAVSQARYDQAARRDTPRLARLNTARSSDMPARYQTAAAPTPGAPSPKPATRRSSGASTSYVIVIDPGHGGRDPGAQAVTGIHEKDVVLKAAKRLRDILADNPRYDVRLTRDDDTFLELEERVTLARQWQADLFVSIHADAHRNAETSGASVYTLSTRGQRRVALVAEQNNWRLPIEEDVPAEVTDILSDLIKRETKTNSGLFAELLIPELARAGPVLRNTHRNAGFYVLLAPDVPAVLLEMGFLTNRADARRVASRQGRERSMQAVARAIDQYFARQDLIFVEVN